MPNIMDFSPLWGEWQVKDKLGEGSYSSAYRVEREEYGVRYESAVKHIEIPLKGQTFEQIIAEGMASDECSAAVYCDTLREALMNEIHTCYELRGISNIVSYEDHLILPRKDTYGYDIFIRMELLESLPSYQRRNGRLDEKAVIRLSKDICDALIVLSRKNIVHRDIKPANIFVTRDGVFKLGDFGESKVFGQAMGYMTVRGTLSYMAPEVYNHQPANRTVDIYSLGMVMYRLLNNNRPPFLPTDTSTYSLDQSTASDVRRFRGDALPPPINCSESLAKIILKACSFDPNARWASPEEMKRAIEEYEKAEYTVRQPDNALNYSKTRASGLGNSLNLNNVQHYQSGNEKCASKDTVDNKKENKPYWLVSLIFLLLVGAVVLIICLPYCTEKEGTAKRDTGSGSDSAQSTVAATDPATEPATEPPTKEYTEYLFTDEQKEAYDEGIVLLAKFCESCDKSVIADAKEKFASAGGYKNASKYYDVLTICESDNDANAAAALLNYAGDEYVNKLLINKEEYFYQFLIGKWVGDEQNHSDKGWYMNMDENYVFSYNLPNFGNDQSKGTYVIRNGEYWHTIDGENYLYWTFEIIDRDHISAYCNDGDFMLYLKRPS